MSQRSGFYFDFKTMVWNSGNMVNKLIALNIAIFIVFGLLNVLQNLMDVPEPNFGTWVDKWIFMLPSNLGNLVYRPYTLFTYSFYHIGLMHVLFNMLYLNFAGRIFREFLGDRRIFGLYLFSALTGALLYLLAYNIIPKFSALTDATLHGASAAVLGILVGAATIVPNYSIRLLLIGEVKLKYLALGLLVIDLLFLDKGNAGGHFAHIGGAFGGWFYVTMVKSGRDFLSWIQPLTHPAPKPRMSNREAAMQASRKSSVLTPRMGGMSQSADNSAKKAKNEEPVFSGNVTEEEIDRILDKISQSGYDSLSVKEKEILFKASQK